ncbi:MAG: S-adenosylmethionine-diacylglycerol 3-amino-3-carboxypropyl transferase [Rubritalea sp.]|jgi:S-adenosylmethionine-diacylglycerol 3-amino-3-carboxypropyl transferase
MITSNSTEIQDHAEFNAVRYANCWEDADILMQAMQPNGRHCLSIGSAGDNSFSMLAEGASHVTIAEINPAQIACIKLRGAAYKTLSHSEFLILLGEQKGDRLALFDRCKNELDTESIAYWEHFFNHIKTGFGKVGKFENYFRLFREKALPWVHSRKTISHLLEPRTRDERELFYEKKWNTWRWRLLFKLFFSRFVMGRLGRDPSFFKYVEGSVADRILTRARHALVELDPSENPYLRSILNGNYGTSLPHALREENFEKIKSNIDRLTIVEGTVESSLTEKKYDAYNLSDIFEYMSDDNTQNLLGSIHAQSNPAARIVYWNMLAPRESSESLRSKIKPLTSLSEDLFGQDKAFFYSKFVVEEVI